MITIVVNPFKLHPIKILLHSRLSFENDAIIFAYVILYSKLTYKFNDTHSPLHSPAVKCCSYHNILPRKTIYLLVIFFLSIKKSLSPQKLYGIHGDSMRCDKFGDENMRRSYEFYYVCIHH